MFDASPDLCALPPVAAGAVVVALPVRDEAGLIGPCLRALLGQSRPADFILLLLNNCRDETRAAIQAVAPGGSRLLLAETELPAALACAGEARRLALNLAAGLAPEGVLLTTDADGVVPPSWVADNMAQLRAGAELVCGQARIRAQDLAALPDWLRAELGLEEAYAARLDALAAWLDPDPADPWPRHQQHSGASLAMRAATLRRAGGAPAVRAGEDRALVAAFQRVDARIRHAPEIEVEVSGRLQGRAPGGMADSLEQRLRGGVALADARLEPVAARLRRLRARVAARQAWAQGRGAPALARRLALPEARLAQALRQPCFGTAWALLQAHSPVLRPVPLPVSALAAQTQRATQLLTWLRQPARPPLETLRAG